MAQRAIDAENIFNALPIEKREKFNFSPTEFFTKFGTDEFNEIMGFEADVLAGAGVAVSDVSGDEVSDVDDDKEVK